MLDSNQKSAADKFLKGKLDRRSFMITTGIFAGSVTLGGLLSYLYRKHKSSRSYSKSEIDIINRFHQHLFPKSDDSPGAAEINSTDYLQFILLDPEIDEDNKSLLISGITWLEEECSKVLNKSFLDTTDEEKDKVLRSIENTNWGYRYISLNLNYILEALLSDPIYGANINEIGWKWLEHTPGVPRPTKNTMYGKI
jgi:gluconate 2-dehydrogenase gamma chain